MDSKRILSATYKASNYNIVEYIDKYSKVSRVNEWNKNKFNEVEIYIYIYRFVRRGRAWPGGQRCDYLLMSALLAIEMQQSQCVKTVNCDEGTCVGFRPQ